MSHTFDRRSVLLGGAALVGSALLPRSARAQASPIRIGILTDMNGPLSQMNGPGTVLAATMAIEDFAKLQPRIKVELLSADMQNKPDVTVSIAKKWLDDENVDLLTDVPISAGALAIGQLVAQRDKLAIFTSALSTQLTGPACGTNHLQWTADTWANSRALVDAQLAGGGKTWFFITANTAFGQDLERESTGFIVKGGGKVLGSVQHPFPGNTDFSSYLLQAQASGADVIGLANSGPDAVNCVKQAAEFKIIPKQKLAALSMEITAIKSVGLDLARGVLLTDAFYWNTNDKTRAFSQRFAARHGGKMPTAQHAGQYSAVMAYLNTVAQMGVDNAKKSGRAVLAQMRAKPIDDALFGRCTIRVDGRVTHPMYVFEVKSPADSKSPDDIYNLRKLVPPEEAFRPLGEGGCPLVKA